MEEDNASNLYLNGGPGNVISICAVKAQTEKDSADDYPKITDYFCRVVASSKKEKKLSCTANVQVKEQVVREGKGVRKVLEQ